MILTAHENTGIYHAYWNLDPSDFYRYDLHCIVKPIYQTCRQVPVYGSITW